MIGIIISRSEAEEGKAVAWRAYEHGIITAPVAAEIAVDLEARAVPEADR
jgi:hypothetical protein